MAIVQSPLIGLTKLTSGTAPAIGKINVYDASSGAISATLPALSGLNVGARLRVSKSDGDSSTNYVTISCAGSDTFQNPSTTSLTLLNPGDSAVLQVISVSSVKYWSFLTFSRRGRSLMKNTWLPEDYGLLAWSADPALCSTAAVINSPGLLALVSIRITEPMTITNVCAAINTAGSGLTSGQNFAALYQNNSLLAATADQSTAWASTGLKTMALTSPQAVTPGMVQVGFYHNGTTGPQFLQQAGYLFMTSSLGIRSGSVSGGFTTAPPASVSTQAVYSRTYWAAVS